MTLGELDLMNRGPPKQKEADRRFDDLPHCVRFHEEGEASLREQAHRTATSLNEESVQAYQ